MTTIEKFQELLKKLFQFEWADLDFGIYRILNYKRRQIEKFIDEDLKNKVESAFARWLVDELEEHPKAIPLGGSKFRNIEGKEIIKLLRNFHPTKIKQNFFLSLRAWAFKNNKLNKVSCLPIKGGR
jgi:hypothetical protein